MSIKNLVLDYIRYKELNWRGHVQRKYEEGLLQNFFECFHLEEEENEDLEIRECRKEQLQ